jgi:hypothetical protein
LDLVGFNPKAPPPRTSAWWEIVDANRPPEEEELQEMFERFYNPAVITLLQIKMSGISQELFGWFNDKKNQRVIPQRLGKCRYSVFRNPGNKGGLWNIGGKLLMVYGRHGLSNEELGAGVRGLQEKYKAGDFMG